jgi:hypothetical protein
MKINRNILDSGHRIPSIRTLLLRAWIGPLGDCAASAGAALDGPCGAAMGADELSPGGFGAVGFPQRLQ